MNSKQAMKLKLGGAVALAFLWGATLTSCNSKAAAEETARQDQKIAAAAAADSAKAVADSLAAKAKADSLDLATKAILPHKRIIAYYGNPMSKRMGILGELPPKQMLKKLDEEVKTWTKVDPATPVQPALHVIVVTAQGQPGKGGKYRLRMSDHVADSVISWAKQRNAIVFLDIQIGQSTLQEEIPRLEKWLKLPQVHLGIDPEFAMKNGAVPGRRVGTIDASEINYATGVLADIAKRYNLPPKILVVHRFTQRMVTNYKQIRLRPNVQFVMHMDGWGDRILKKSTYNDYIKKEPVQYTGFKIFYKNDTKKAGWKLYDPKDLLKLTPVPLYIQYQ
ncbi:hypothetical protein [Rufibacter sp. DG15C]|uniref:hypothetical protein n=1 Tax=Rufibacter sp. DG15C TaxID=1379909 RepID=UPI000ABB1651|nr:hypothetical protein [Rufibacter sp. DG15C]